MDNNKKTYKYPKNSDSEEESNDYRKKKKRKKILGVKIKILNNLLHKAMVTNKKMKI